MNDVPEALKVDSKFMPPKGSLICMDLFHKYREAKIVPSGDEYLDNNFLSSE